MLNLPIAMLTKKWRFLMTVLCFLLLGAQTQPQPDQPRLVSPLPGAALQGSVTVSGFTDLPDFQSAEVSFSYMSSQPESWFLIKQLLAPDKEGPLTVWDTTTIADGNYRLRLQVFLTTGKMVETSISSLRVRNYSAVETNTPTSLNAQAATRPPLPPTSIPLTSTPRSTPTPLRPNPAQVQPSNLVDSLGLGVGITVLLFILLALYQAAHHQGRSG
jgi:hypothetical protein